MSGTDAKMVDRAYWDAGILEAARNCGANAVAVYAWDHYLNDVNGYCGGYTPAVVAQLYAAGLDVHFVFCFRDGEAPLDPATCVEILSKLGAKPGAWVHNDIENGAMDSLAHDVAFNQAMRKAGYHPAPYGLASTLNGGYLAYADGAWAASYVRPWNDPPALVYVPYVGAWDYVGWQYSTDSPPPVTVDVSVHNFPPAGDPAPPAGGTVSPQPPFYVTVHPDAHWFDQPDGADQGPVNVDHSQPLRVVQVANDGANDWYRLDLGAWWILAGKTSPAATPAPPPPPPAPPAPQPDLNAVAAQLRDLAHQLDGR